ncbi:MAG: ATP-dependent DNA helicase RecQ [Gemmatimonadaceae bacterium]
MPRARTLLKRYFGYDDFRPGQVDVVESVLSGNDTLGVLPTGGGKSLCYQVPALTLPGLTVVISPLISLMKDQVDRLRSRGVASAFLNSTLPPGQVATTMAQAQQGHLTLLYAAPERFEAPDLMRCLAKSRVSLLAVDEAHCISEWGHDFRPSFRRIADVSERLGRPQVIALTATATPRVRRDIERQLRMRRPRIIVCGFDRTNLSYAVTPCRADADKDRALLHALGHHGRPSIVYAPTRAAVNRIARQLARAGLRAAPYHGGLHDDIRHEVQERFMRGGVDTIVATNAFGMGIDKPDVRLVVHYAMPGTLEAYYQEAGRAGRDGMAAHCVLLHAYKDRFTHEWFINGTFPTRDSVARVHETLRVLCARNAAPANAAALARHCRGLLPRDVESGLRLLRQHGVVLDPDPVDAKLWVRLVATPARIRRELGAATTGEILVLRDLWRRHGARLEEGVVLHAATLPRSVRGAKGVLQRLRENQFVDCSPVDGLRLHDPGAAFGSLAINWDAIARRRRSELEKLDMMQGYAFTRKCRRSFVLAYFGERRTDRRCGGCDNCLPQ